MPWIESAKKRHRQNVKSRIRNRAVKAELKSSIKVYLAAVKEGRLDDAKKQLQVCFGKLDKAGLRRYIHPNAANRYKSRLSRRLHAKPVAAAAGS